MNLVIFWKITAKIVFVIILLGKTPSVAYAECPNIRIFGTSYVHDGVGNYDMMSEVTCSGRPVYSQLGGAFELYYADDLHNGTSYGWVVGVEENRCSVHQSIMLVEDAASYAEDIQEVWKESVNDTFIESVSVEVDCNTGFDGCTNLDITDTQNLAGTPFAGVYHLTNTSYMCNGRNVYHYDSSKLHIYSAGGMWVIGPVVCSDSDDGLLARVSDAALYPEHISGVWQEIDSGDWRTSDMNVHCYEDSDGMSAGAIAGIVIGCLFILAGCIAAAVLFWPILKENWSRKKKGKATTTQVPPPRAPSATGTDNLGLSLDEEDTIPHVISADNNTEYQPQYTEPDDIPVSISDIDNAINDVRNVKHMQEEYRENVI